MQFYATDSDEEEQTIPESPVYITTQVAPIEQLPSPIAISEADVDAISLDSRDLGSADTVSIEDEDSPCLRRYVQGFIEPDGLPVPSLSELLALDSAELAQMAAAHFASALPTPIPDFSVDDALQLMGGA